MNEYSSHNRPDDQDGPAPPGAPPPGPGSDDPGARLRRALSRNTLLPQDVPSTSSKSNTGGSEAASASAGVPFVPFQDDVTPTASARRGLGYKKRRFYGLMIDLLFD
jgi:hypothetical protein